jgi:sugar-specific transcriptional regulator TrmB
MEYEKTLQNIGLSKLEAGVYLAILQLGKSLPANLAKKAKIKRPTLYKVIPELKDLGLISETVIGKRKYIVAEDPQSYLDRKNNELKDFENSIPELRLLLNTATVKPKIVFYEGIKGIEKLYMETLKEKKPILEFVSLENISQEIESYSRNYYIPQRINIKIPIKIIVSGKTESKLIKLKNESWALREVKTIDEKKFPIPLDCYIFSNNVAFALYRKDSEPVGILIRSFEVATILRSLFNFIWEK